MKAILFDAQLKVFAHFVTIENLTRAQPDIVLAAERTFGAPGGHGDLLQLLLGGRRMIKKKKRELLGQEGSEAGNQTFAREIGMSDLNQIGPVEKGHLQLAILG